MLFKQKEVIIIVTIEEIDYTNSEVYQKFLIDKKSKIGSKNVFACGARCNNIPCGAILASLVQCSNTKQEVKISSFFVLPFFRKKGVGSLLLNSLIYKIDNLGIQKIKVIAITSEKNIYLLEHFLLKRGFSKAKLLSIVYLFEPKLLFKENEFIQRISMSSLKLPEKIKFLQEDDISLDLIKKVKNKDGIDYPDVLSPFANEFELEREYIEFAVYDDKEIVGWITALKAEVNAILYRTFFIREDFRKQGLGCFLFNDCVKKHVEKYIEKRGMFAVDLKNTNARKLFSLYFKGLCIETRYEFEIDMNIEK